MNDEFSCGERGNMREKIMDFGLYLLTDNASCLLLVVRSGLGNDLE